MGLQFVVGPIELIIALPTNAGNIAHGSKFLLNTFQILCKFHFILRCLRASKGAGENLSFLKQTSFNVVGHIYDLHYLFLGHWMLKVLIKTDKLILDDS